MNEYAIDAVGLRCAYGSFEAVRGIDLQVRPGELYALLGTNGAGKTTAVETLEGHRRASGGSVRVLGLDPVADRARLRPRTGIMLQESGFAGDLAVAETLQLWGKITTARRGRLDVLDLLDLGHRAQVAVKQLSGGERRRLDLALAVLNKPEVLFLDEPTTGLDPESRKRTWEVVRGLLVEGTTVLLTTHYLEEAETLATRLSIMDEGRISVHGTLAEVLESHPARIAFDLPHGVSVTELPVLPGMSNFVNRAGRIELNSASLQQDLSVLLGWAGQRGVDLGRLRAHHASLEDVFHQVAERMGAVA
ncbi:ABC transporter ATP-binding protein [Allokutzneria sp. A3M-2-11 16]|uniref:ABC transporter ATP-binding protein n=1 Tax=Allokutzneria sp. A3M-2-11 16 TaxID=2962043 RepID=UPI0020B70CB7|nr:ATP-binding cassette domain-containing protein [Allokutzneria sp. A3M-2-11 16]MCP3799097.1 ABC transporter ATP-binding protein [Allokutzneria sp. A3M-2-11 16]